MIESDLIRRIGLGVTAVIFILIAWRAATAPERLATGLGLKPSAPNGYSEIYAIYVGIWLMTAALALLAMYQIKNAFLGDLLALFVLAQPLGRIVAGFRWGWPQGTLRVMFLVELIGGLALLLVRPSA